MPKHEIDYSNTIIYKITCDDSNISDLYVGHTTNFVQRKHAHKQSCINEKSLNYKCKLYDVIRNNGGWENWKMEIINFFNCKNHYEARKKEQEYFLSLTATLNSIEPYAIPKPKEIIVKNTVIKEVFHCKECNKDFSNNDLLEIHNKTNKHKRRMETQKSANSAKIFYCNFCNLECSKKNDFDRHILTNKHIANATGDKKPAKTAFMCEICNKEYKSRNGIWKHNKTCINKSEITKSENIKIEITKPENTMVDLSSNEIKVLTDLVLELVKSNNDLQKQMLEMCKNNNNTIINNNNTNTNSHNKTFNLQVFLNEDCKDAMNMSDFINSIEIKVSDLVNIGKLGYVEGMSNIIIKQLNDTDINKRPVHCSDAKRETLYVKEENKWEKDTQETKQMLTAVWGVNKKNYTLLANWKETHPDCMSSKSNQSDEYMKVVSKVMDGDLENINKVIKKVAKQVVIDK